jgi:hypothetical protein
MLAVAVFSLAIYAWAQRVALPTEEIERLIASVPEEAPDPETVPAAAEHGSRFRRPHSRSGSTRVAQ